MYLINRLRHEVRRVRARWRHRNGAPYSPVLPGRAVRRTLAEHDLGFYKDGTPTWWYSSFDLLRNEDDDLTKAALRFVRDDVDRSGRILITGCGTGWMLIWLGQQGYRRLEGFDYLPNVVAAAKDLAHLSGIQAKLWEDDGFRPELEGTYDAVLVLHWLYSAWMGNYGNPSRADRDRVELLDQFVSRYADHVASGGVMLLELIDSIADLLDPPSEIYPIRHSFEHVQVAAAKYGFTVERRAFNHRYGHLPRMLYWLRKA